MSTSRSFIQVSKAWYSGSALGDDIERFDIIVEGQDWTSEFSVNWPKSSPTGCAVLIALDDAWQALASCNDLISKLASESAKLCPQGLRDHLLACGFTDASEINPMPSKQ